MQAITHFILSTGNLVSGLGFIPYDHQKARRQEVKILKLPSVSIRSMDCVNAFSWRGEVKGDGTPV